MAVVIILIGVMFLVGCFFEKEEGTKLEAETWRPRNKNDKIMKHDDDN